MKLERVVFLLIILIVIAIAGSSQTNTTVATAAISPLATPSSQPIRTAADMRNVDQFYVANPPTVTAKIGQFVDQYGDTVIQQRVAAQEHHAPWIFNLKKPLEIQPESVTNTALPTTFVSPLTLGDYKTYMPLVMKWYPPTKIIYAIDFERYPPQYDPAGIALTNTNLVMNDINTAAAWHGYSNAGQPPSVVYGLYNNTIVITNALPPTRTANGQLDVAAIYSQYGLCAKIQAG